MSKKDFGSVETGGHASVREVQPTQSNFSEAI